MVMSALSLPLLPWSTWRDRASDLPMKCEVELGKVQRPLSLLPVQLLGHMEVLKVLVVLPNLKLAWGTFKVVPPLFQHVDDCQNLLVMDFIVLLDGAEAFGEEGDWMPFSTIL